MPQRSETLHDVFVSYAAEDREVARRLAAALTERGHTVWWDRQIAGGALWGEEIERALAEARAVVVMWSSAAVRSSFVRAEARNAASRKALIPTMIESCDVPMPFGEYQTIDLVEWRCGNDSGAMTLLEDALRRRVSVPVEIEEERGLARHEPPARSTWLTALVTYWTDLIAMATGPKAFLNRRWDDPDLLVRATRFYVATLAIRLALDIPIAFKIHSRLSVELPGAFIFQPIRMVAIGAVVHLMWRAVGGVIPAAKFMGAYAYTYSIMMLLYSCTQVLVVGLMRAMNPTLAEAIFIGTAKGIDWPAFERTVSDYPVASLLLFALAVCPLFIVPFATWGVFRVRSRVSRVRSALAAVLSVVVATVVYMLAVSLSYFSIGPG